VNSTWVVVTSIYMPRNGFLDYIENGLKVVVVGDEKTPEWAWENLKSENFHFLTIADQNELFPEISNLIGTGTYARKNIGYLYAVSHGAKQIWDTDDDTFIRKNAYDLLKRSHELPQTLVVGSGFFNPYIYYAPNSGMWPRGYPLRRVAHDRHFWNDELMLQEAGDLRSFDYLQTLVNLESDVDAIYRMTVSDEVKDFQLTDEVLILGEGVNSPGNTQSTLWTNPMKFPFLYVARYVTFRFSDILKMYIAQAAGQMAYAGFWSEQDRNPHDYMIDFDSEVTCYLNTEKVVSLLAKIPNLSLSSAYEALTKMEICLIKEYELAQKFEETMLELL
jgi:hypothetical protein